MKKNLAENKISLFRLKYTKYRFEIVQKTNKRSRKLNFGVGCPIRGLNDGADRLSLTIEGVIRNTEPQNDSWTLHLKISVTVRAPIAAHDIQTVISEILRAVSFILAKVTAKTKANYFFDEISLKTEILPSF